MTPLPPTLPAAQTAAGNEGLAAVLADPGGTLLACDYDGTLAPIVEDPAVAYAQAGAVEALTALVAVLGSVAVITGRPAGVAVALGGLDAVPGLVVIGAYGAQRWSAGRLDSADEAPLTADVLAAIAEIAGLPGARGARVELKGAAVAVHLRRCPDPQAALSVVLAPLVEVAQQFGLTVEPGRLVVELRRPGHDKGSALRGLVEEVGARSIVFVGDDLGDLAAFVEIQGLRSAGRCPGLIVASSSAEGLAVAAAADLVVDGPSGVVTFLEALVAALDA